MPARRIPVLDLLSDPLVTLMMRADGVDREELASMLARVSSTLTGDAGGVGTEEGAISPGRRDPVTRLRLDTLAASCLADSINAGERSRGRSGPWI